MWEEVVFFGGGFVFSEWWIFLGSYLEFRLDLAALFNFCDVKSEVHLHLETRGRMIFLVYF
jgi:hypothetical protein